MVVSVFQYGHVTPRGVGMNFLVLHMCENWCYRWITEGRARRASPHTPLIPSQENAS